MAEQNSINRAGVLDLLDTKLRKSIVLDRLLSCGLMEVGASFGMSPPPGYNEGYSVVISYVLSEKTREADRRRFGGRLHTAYIKSVGVIKPETLKAYSEEEGIPGVTWKVTMKDNNDTVAFDEFDTVESAVLYLQAVYI